jgi:hypothetical protein
MIGFDKQWTAKDITVAAIEPDRLSPVVFVLWASVGRCRRCLVWVSM